MAPRRMFRVHLGRHENVVHVVGGPSGRQGNATRVVVDLLVGPGRMTVELGEVTLHR